jgi:lipopolysaccharide export system permease protein
VSLEAGRFITDFKGYQLLFGSKDEKTDEVRDVQVYIQRPGKLPDLLVAPRGRLHFENNGNTLYIDLFDGEMHAVPDAQDQSEEDLYRHTLFDEHTVVIDNVGTALERTDRPYRGDREMNVGMLHAAIREQEQQVLQVRERLGEACRRNMDNRLALLDPERRAEYFAAHRPNSSRRLVRDEERLRDTVRMEASSIDASVRQIRSYEVEIQKKFAIPAASLIFVLVGAPLAIWAGRGGGNIAIALSMVCFTVYYLFLIGGEKLADRRLVSPYVAMWAANFAFAALGAILTWRISVESTPIHWREILPRRWQRARQGGGSAPPPVAAA